jgi:hypothetical protein
MSPEPTSHLAYSDLRFGSAHRKQTPFICCPRAVRRLAKTLLVGFVVQFFLRYKELS